MSKFGKALGLLEMKIDDVELELKPTFKHVRKFRKIIMDEKLSKDKNALFDRLSDYVLEIIREFENESFDEEEVRFFIELNIMDFFKEFMIAYKYSTREKWDEQEKQSVAELKNHLASR